MNPLTKLISALFVFSIKYVSKLFYNTEAVWLTPKENIHWEEMRLLIMLNHTSLFEPLFISAIPNLRLWRAIRRVVIPVADVTMNRPFVGHLFKFMIPNAIGITRKRDASWEKIINAAQGESIVALFPEGRMKRLDGLDKHGKPMSVKGGIADILARLDDGKIFIAYSGGLHHVQAPGQTMPKLFKKIKITFEELDVADYKKKLHDENSKEFQKKVIKDLEARKAIHCQ